MGAVGSRLTLEQRISIQVDLSKGVSVKKIATAMNIAPSTIFRDIKKCKGKYDAKMLQSTKRRGAPPIDLSIIGRKFGMLTVTGLVEIKDKRSWWKCKCDCGQETIFSRKTLFERTGKNKQYNCGCLGIRQSYQKKREIEASMMSRFHHMQKFIEKVDGCWLWKGYINNKSGCPMTSWNSKVIAARRMMYIIFNETIEPTDRVYAGCGEKLCVNPKHLVCGVVPKGFYQSHLK